MTHARTLAAAILTISVGGMLVAQDTDPMVRVVAIDVDEATGATTRTVIDDSTGTITLGEDTDFVDIDVQGVGRLRITHKDAPEPYPPMPQDATRDEQRQAWTRRIAWAGDKLPRLKRVVRDLFGTSSPIAKDILAAESVETMRDRLTATTSLMQQMVGDGP